MSGVALFLFTIIATVGIALSQKLPSDYPAPPATYEASSFTKWDGTISVDGSKRGMINVQFQDAEGNDDYINVFRVDLVGDSQQRGFAHGALLAKEIREFTTVQLDKYIASMVMDLDISSLPEPIQKIVEKAQKGLAILAPKVFREAMEFVWKNEEQYAPKNLITELDAVAEGMCSVLDKCDVDHWKKTLREVNMLPELIRMSCTAYGAWGKAKNSQEDAGLLQLRALDFGGGPFANNTVVMTHRNDPNNPNHAFTMVTFPGFIGAITGVAQNGIGISEKVWMTYDKRSIQPGNYKGEADVFALRYILEFAKSKEEAVEYLQSIHRTWAMWIGVGDFASQELNLVGYKEESATAYTDVTMPAMNGQPFLDSVAYVDKHPQPSNDGANGTLPTALTSFYGQINMDTTKQIIQYHQTGDLHAAAYDFHSKKMQLTIGKINENGEYHPDADTNPADSCAWCAYNRPWLSFDMVDLWTGK